MEGSTYLESDGGEGGAHAAVKCRWALGRDDAAEEPDGGGGAAVDGRGGLLQPDPEGVEGVSGDDPGHAPKPSRHEFPTPAARQELRPELHRSTIPQLPSQVPTPPI